MDFEEIQSKHELSQQWHSDKFQFFQMMSTKWAAIIRMSYNYQNYSETWKEAILPMVSGNLYQFQIHY